MYNIFENNANEFNTKNYNFPAPKTSAGNPLTKALINIDSVIKEHDDKHIKRENNLSGRIDKEIEMRDQGDNNLDLRISKYHKSIIINVSESYAWGTVAFNIYGSGDIVTICNIHTINKSQMKQQFSIKKEEVKGMIQTGIGSIVVLIRDNVQSVESLPVNIDNDTISFGVERGQMFGSAIVVQRRLE